MGRHHSPEWGLLRRVSGPFSRPSEPCRINSSLPSSAHLEYSRVAERPGEREPAGQFQEFHEEVFVEVEVLQLASSLQRAQLDVLHREVLGESAREIFRRVRQTWNVDFAGNTRSDDRAR